MVGADGARSRTRQLAGALPALPPPQDACHPPHLCWVASGMGAPSLNDLHGVLKICPLDMQQGCGNRRRTLPAELHASACDPCALPLRQLHMHACPTHHLVMPL